MRMMPSRYTQPRPAQIKRQVARVQHISAPLKGLSLSTKLVPGDPLSAVVLDNWTVEENLIRARPGTALQLAITGGTPVETLVPFFGSPNKLAAASGGKLVALDGTVIHSGFTGNDWSFTSFSNLSDTEFTVMANGLDGVWSWDGAAMVKEAITAPAGKPYIDPDQFQIALSHMNRLWFADGTNLSVYYLPLQQKSGEVKELPLNAIFKRGGNIRALATWTVDGGGGLDDQLVIFTSNGEAAIYGGTDPDSDFSLTGIYLFDSPMSKHSVVNYGGDLYCLISTGLVPMSQLMRAETEQLGRISDKQVFSAFATASTRRAVPGWMVLLDHTTGRMICNFPQGGKSYRQMVRFTPNLVWATWSALPARSWGWVDNRLFIGSDDGRVYEISPLNLNDAGLPIKVDVQGAWSSFGTPASKQFKMVLPYLQTDGNPLPFVDIKVDYDTTAPTNQPDVTFGGGPAGVWDLATWDVDNWGGELVRRNNWSGVGVLGRVGAPRLVALISNCEFALAGWDVIYETGSVLG
ncbi:hypothetical protein [Mesorhizobium sp.]|uniref:hypothetical protein n=1 Tax=Mesorhizobium sp. TaxID=1871066 RepID=UPI000FEA80C5|nr:hypothetical protein [Mesorhizobium sp.]RWP05099.1 MAG: hypothetical protein EOQ99_16650 [Mesorhizobium sp.]